MYGVAVVDMLSMEIQVQIVVCMFLVKRGSEPRDSSKRLVASDAVVESTLS
jgi:hypothetical protein